MSKLPPTHEELARLLADPVWRLSNLYYIRDRSKRKRLFRPNAEQLAIIHAIHKRGLKRLLILKARQLGMSTVIGIIIADMMLFNNGIQASLVDETQPQAWAKLDDIVRFAINSVDKELLAPFEPMADNKGELTFRWRGEGAETERSFIAGMKARGGTNNILWLSEWGCIQHENPEHSTEIKTGALRTVSGPDTLIVVETTWKGGRKGDLWDIVSAAKEISPLSRGPMDWAIFFFPWYNEAAYVDEGDVPLTSETTAYFDALEKSGMIPRLSDAKKRWYQKTKRELKNLMLREYPTTEEECYESLGDTAFFDHAGLKWQESQAMGLSTQWGYYQVDLSEDLRTPFYSRVEQRLATTRILRLPQEGESYLIVADFGVGKRASGLADGKLDSNAWAVWRAGRMRDGTLLAPQKVACCQPDDRAGTAETCRRIASLAVLYGDCIVVAETNNKDNICEQLTVAGVKKLWTKRVGEGGVRPGDARIVLVPGWYTNEGTRKQALDNLYEQVLQQSFIVANEDAVHQYRTFIRNKDGRPEASSAEHDDWVMSDAIGLFCINSATLYQSPGLRAQAAGGSTFDPSRYVLRPGGV